MTEFMRQTDAFAWAMESDPRLRSTVVAVILLDRSPDWDELRYRFDVISRKFPVFRQRVVESPPPAPPRWQDCPDFDLDFHMRRVTAPRPGTLVSVLELARLAQMEAFDRARPLWKVTLIDGLTNGAAAVLWTFHHSLTDGVGSVQIATTLFDSAERPQHRVELPTEPPMLRTSWLDGYRDTLRYIARRAVSALTGAVEFDRLADESRYSATGRHGGCSACDRRIGVSDSAPRESDWVATYEAAQPYPLPGCARGVDATTARGRTPLRCGAQRRVHRGCDRRAAPIPREAWRLHWRSAHDDANQPAHKGGRNGR